MIARPILFSPSMVAAILDGRKSVTRRLMKPQPVQIDVAGGRIWQYRPKGGVYDSAADGTWPRWMTRHVSDDDAAIHRSACPYGAAGDILWIREEHYRYGHWEPVLGGLTRKGKRQKWAFVPDSEEVRYAAPAEYLSGKSPKTPGASMWCKRLARFMPRSCSRLTLEVTGVSVGRVQSITEEQAVAEGAEAIGITFREGVTGPLSSLGGPYRDGFRILWSSLHGPDSWDANPWCWEISFRVAATSPAPVR